MRRVVLVLALAVLLLAPAALAGVPRMEMRPYTGGGVLYCGTVTLGGACFRLDGSETKVSLLVRDVTNAAMSVFYNFRKATPTTSSLGFGFFCVKVNDLAIPAGAEVMDIAVEPYDDVTGCGIEYPTATRGTIQANFA